MKILRRMHGKQSQNLRQERLSGKRQNGMRRTKSDTNKFCGGSKEEFQVQRDISRPSGERS